MPLSKEFHIPWVPNYRDNWSNEPMKNPETDSLLLDKLLQPFHRKQERLLLSTTRQVVATGPDKPQLIARTYSGNKIHIIENGHDFPPNFKAQPLAADKLVITHIGRLCRHRNPALFFKGVAKWLESAPKMGIELKFIGLDDFPKQKEKLLEMADPLLSFISTTLAVPYNEMLCLASASHGFLLLSNPNLPLTNRKMYNSPGLQRPIILAPEDRSIFCELIEREHCGFFADSPEEGVAILDKMANNLNNPAFFETPVNREKYSRRESTRLLAELIREIAKEQSKMKQVCAA